MEQYTTHQFFIDGPAGKLETVLAEPKSIPKGIAIIAHPHPLHSGTMNNKIITTLFKSLLEIGFIAVKFNFRGVGKSEGDFADGVGEIEDVITVANGIRERYHNVIPHPSLLLAGFSFGGGIQLHAAIKLKPEFLILVAPSVKNLNVPPASKDIKSTLIIHGEHDEIVSIKTIFDWAAPQSLPVVVIPGAEHFFHGKLATLRKTILQFGPKLE